MTAPSCWHPDRRQQQSQHSQQPGRSQQEIALGRQQGDDSSSTATSPEQRPLIAERPASRIPSCPRPSPAAAAAAASMAAAAARWSSSSGGGGLYSGSRVACAPSTSGPSQAIRQPAWKPARHLRSGTSCRRVPPPPPSASPDSSSSGASSQVFRFRHDFNPGASGAPLDAWLGVPMPADPALPSGRVRVAGEADRLAPESLWAADGPAGLLALPNPHASHFRVAPLALPGAAPHPNVELWQVEAGRNYAAGWPSLRFAAGKFEFRPGFLTAVDDPKVVPFFFYRGLEVLTYSWGERAAQAAVAAAYLGVHAAVFGTAWAASPLLGGALALNWALGRLSLGKLLLLLALAAHGRLWLYAAFEVGRLVDAGLARLFPPLRQFFWAMFTVWALYVVASPAHYYPLPFAPFAPGTMGAQEAVC